MVWLGNKVVFICVNLCHLWMQIFVICGCPLLFRDFVRHVS